MWGLACWGKMEQLGLLGLRLPLAGRVLGLADRMPGEAKHYVKPRLPG